MNECYSYYMIIYKITNDINNKVYIGQTIETLADRWSAHSRPHQGKNKAKSLIAQAIRKYGKNHFTMVQIDSASSIEELNNLEIRYIKEYNCKAPYGYNLQDGGDNKTCHPDTRLKISKSLKGTQIKNRMNGASKGRPVSEERRARISKTMTGVAQPWKYKKVLCVETGIVYESVQKAAIDLGIKRPNLSYLLINGGKHRKTGLTFKYAE